ncbi:MAG: peptidylprolyl isomerase [Chloroflexota bacterium]
MNQRIKYIPILLLLTITLAGCTLTPAADNTPPTATVPIIPSATPGPSLTPTEVVVYYAAVNGFGIRQSSFDASLLQFHTALKVYPDLLPADRTAEEVILESLVQRALLVLAAREAGFSADEQTVETRLAGMVLEAGGVDPFNAWLTENGYSVETFLHELSLDIEAAWQRDQIANTVPATAEQLLARQIFFVDGYQASRAYNQLEAGISFENILQNNSPNDPGYIDWFPRGYLIYPEVEETLFNLQPGQFSPVIETPAGYHIVYLLERDPQHPLSSEVRLTLQQQAVEAWLAEQQAQSQVEIYTP